MAVRLRLQRHGKKGKPFYHVVAADQRSPRDGKFIEKIGVYNPTTVPATIELNFDAAVNWLQKGAEPSNTVKAILSYRGALYKNHLLNGVHKGALTLEQAEAKFAAWQADKDQKINAHVDRVTKSKDDAKAAKFAAEQEVNTKRLAEAAKVQAEAEAAIQAEKAAAEAEKAAAEAKVVAEAEAETQAEETSAENTTTEETPAE